MRVWLLFVLVALGAACSTQGTAPEPDHGAPLDSGPGLEARAADAQLKGDTVECPVTVASASK